MTPLEALQQSLAAEHAAVHVLSALGGVVPASSQARLATLVRERYTLHRGRREHLMVLVRNAGGDPVPAEVAYALPEAASPGASAEEVRAATLEVEQRCTQTYAAQVASTTREERAWAIMALTENAAVHLRLGGTAEPFPGAPELTP